LERDILKRFDQEEGGTSYEEGIIKKVSTFYDIEIA